MLRKRPANLSGPISPHKIQVIAGLLSLDAEIAGRGSWAGNAMIRAVGINWSSRYTVVRHDRREGDAVEGPGPGGYTLPRRGGRVVECGGLENRYVGNPGVGGSNPPLSALSGYRLQQESEAWNLTPLTPERV